VGEASSGWSLGVGGALEWVELWSGWSLRVVVNLHFSKSRTSNLSWHYQADGTALAQTLDENVTDLVLPIIIAVILVWRIVIQEIVSLKRSI